MSRGLGRMQRLILERLRARTGGDLLRPNASWDDDIPLADGIHDVREVNRELAPKNGGISHCGFTSPKWQASFSRALRGLEDRGLIESLSVVPLALANPNKPHILSYGQVTRLYEGLYLVVNRDTQRRFVRLLASTILGLIVATSQPARAQGACGAIRDFERRQACIAVQDANPAECASLKDADAKTLCRIKAEAARAQRR